MGETEADRVVAFERLAEQRLDMSYRLATAVLRDDDQAKDAVRDAVVLAWQRWPSLRDRSRFDAWFDRIVVNVCRNRLRGQRRRPTSEIAAAASIGMTDPAAEVDHRIVVEQALDRLKRTTSSSSRSSTSSTSRTRTSRCCSMSHSPPPRHGSARLGPGSARSWSESHQDRVRS